MNIPYYNIEIERIFSQILHQPGSAIAVCSAVTGEGVTSVAAALAQRNLLAGRSTLLVDMNLHHPAIESLLDLETASFIPEQSISQSKLITTDNNAALLMSPQLVSVNNSQLVLTGITAPSGRKQVMKLRQPGILEEYIATWLQQFDNVIFDTSPLNHINARNINPERVAAACDGAILVVLAGQTTEAMVATAVDKLRTANAQLLGSILNDRDNPSLQHELMREVERLAPRFRWIRKRIHRFLRNNRLLTLEF